MKAIARLGGLLSVAVLALTLASAVAFAQGGGGGGGGFGGQQMDPAQIRQFMVDNAKNNVTATDAEWTVISPLLDKYYEKQLAQLGSGFAAGGFGGGRGGRGGRGGPGGGGGGMFGGTPAPEVAALTTAAADEKATPEDLKAKLKAYRDAKAKAAKEMDDARAALTKVLNVRQEAQLVLMGVLQ